MELPWETTDQHIRSGHRNPKPRLKVQKFDNVFGFSFLPSSKAMLTFSEAGNVHLSQKGGGEKGQMNLLNVGLGVCAALVYAFLGYAAQDKPFSFKKFLRTVAIGVFAALGLDVAGMTFDVYTALVGPTAITVWLQKLVDTAKP